MASVTITINNADAADVAAAYGVSTVPEFKTALIETIKTQVKIYKRRLATEALASPIEPDIT